MLQIFACSDQLIYFDVLCVYVNHYVLLTRLFEVLQSRMTGVPDVFDKIKDEVIKKFFSVNDNVHYSSLLLMLPCREWIYRYVMDFTEFLKND